MDFEYLEQKLKRKHQLHTLTNTQQKKKVPKELQNIFSRVLIAIIFVLISTIYTSWSKNNLNNYKKQVFETNISFASINNWYQNKFGNILPFDMKDNTISVNKTPNDIQNVVKYYDGVMAEKESGSVIEALNSGIVVFVGEKENYGNVVIIQGIDGVDVWYGNIDNVNVSLYDYVEKNTILGSAKENHIYFVVQKDGQYLDYEEYKSQI